MKAYVRLALFSSVFFFIIYYSDFGYSQLYKFLNQHPKGLVVLSKIDELMNEFDISRALSDVEIKNENYIDLDISKKNVRYIYSKMNFFLEKGFIKDEDNKWKKGRLKVNGALEDVKFKFHGTSTSPMKKGGYSIKIKHKKSGNYLNQMRRYNLITMKDDAREGTIAINNFAESIGLVAPFGRMVMLRINGSKVGPYMLIENHKKEFFERKHRMTNYMIIQSNDDWDSKEMSHDKDTDLFIHNKELSGANSDIALGSLEILFNAIKAKDINVVKNMIDVEYMAKFMSLLTIVNNSHQITGDNLRYIYDFTSGKFKIMFRLEGGVLPINPGINNFNRSLFMTPLDYQDSLTHKLFKMLVMDGKFRERRDKALWDIVGSNNEIIEFSQNVYKNNTIIQNSSMSRRRNTFDEIYFFQTLKQNIKHVKDYLSYNKVFATVINKQNRISLSILNDSFVAIEMSAEGNNKTQFNNENVTSINAPNLREDLYIEHKPTLISINETPKKLKFRNKTINSYVKEKDVYLNSLTSRRYHGHRESLEMLDRNNINYSIDDKTLTVEAGNYKLLSDVIFPVGLDVTISSGTIFNLDKDVSMLIQGGASIVGALESPVIVRRLSDFPFGVFAIRPIIKSKVIISDFSISGGGQSAINGALFTGQLSINNAYVDLNHISVSNSISDDGINIKYSDINIKNSSFFNNFGDQIDLDYCNGVVSNNSFAYDKLSLLDQGLTNSFGQDGLDVSGSKIRIADNDFNNFSDKGVSVGEESSVLIERNTIKNSALAIAVKDGSIAYIKRNKFSQNVKKYSLYIKKNFYKSPTVYLDKKPDASNVYNNNSSIIISHEREMESLYGE
jgi:hypothetical protein